MNSSIMSKLTYRGYVIQKSSLSSDQLAALKYDLAIAPKENHVVKMAKKSNNDNLIIVYRENEQKIYIPRFYGVRHFGEPGLSELSPGLDIDVSFTQTLRDYQEKIINVYMSHIRLPGSDSGGGGGGGILEVPCGAGKTIMALNICSRLKKKR